MSLAGPGSGSHHGQASAVDAMYQAEVQRMELAHEKSVAALQHNMTMRSAFAYLQENPKATPELLQLVQRLTMQYEAAHRSRPFQDSRRRPSQQDTVAWTKLATC